MDKQNKALIVVENNFLPLDIRVWQEATSLRDAGWTVTVVCPAPAGAVLLRARARRSTGSGGHSSVLLCARRNKRRHGVLCEGILDGILEHQQPAPKAVMLFHRLLGTAVLYDHHNLFPEFVKHRFGGLADRILSRTAVLMSSSRLLSRGKPP